MIRIDSGKIKFKWDSSGWMTLCSNPANEEFLLEARCCWDAKQNFFKAKLSFPCLVTFEAVFISWIWDVKITQPRKKNTSS